MIDLLSPTLATVRTEENNFHVWRNHLLALGAILVLILAEFHHAVAAATTVWVVSPTYSHCFLIIPIVGWLIWEKREAVKSIKPAIEPRALLLIPPLLMIWWAGQLLAVNEIIQYAIIGLIQIAIVALLGTRVARKLWFPIFFLLFLVPTGEYLTPLMQRFATQFVDVSLNIIGIPHYTEGTVIELTNGRFEIAEACAGLRFLIATVTLGVLFAYLMYQRIYKIVLFLFASVAIPLIGNGLRCLGIILLAHFTSNAYGAGADHIIYGWGFNVAILLAVILIGSMFRDEPRKSEPASAAMSIMPGGAMAAFLVALVAGGLISAGPAWALLEDGGSISLDRSVLQIALQSSGWHKAAPDNWRPFFPGADLRVEAERLEGAEPVNLFIGYYARPRAGRTVTAQPNRPWDEKVWGAFGGGQVRADLGSSSIPLTEFVISSETGKRLVWFTYWTDDAVTTSALRVRLLAAKATLIGHEGQAIIAVSSPLDDSREVVRHRLSFSLSSLETLSGALHHLKPSSIQRGG